MLESKFQIICFETFILINGYNIKQVTIRVKIPKSEIRNFEFFFLFLLRNQIVKCK